MESFRDFLREFSSSWFAVVMGTGVFTTATSMIGSDHHISFLILFSEILAFLNFLLFAVVLGPFLIKIFVFADAVREDFRDPFRANFYVTFGVAMLTLSTNFSVVVPVDTFYHFFWFAGAITVIVIEMLIMLITFMERHIQLEHINPSWFLGATGLLLIPGTGAGIVSVPYLRDLALFLFDFTFGAGFFIYLALFAIWMYRFILHAPLKGNRIPLFWINLGPIGAFLTSISTYYYGIFGLHDSTTLFALLFFGNGVWWFFMALLITLYYLRRMNIPYRTAWWSFTFPVGQFLVGSYFLNSIIGYRSIDEFVMFLYAILIILWVINVGMTLAAVLRGNIRIAQILD